MHGVKSTSICDNSHFDLAYNQLKKGCTMRLHPDKPVDPGTICMCVLW